MATLIPALGSRTARMTPGERRLAERLEHKLEDDYLLWYDVPVGPKQLHPDFAPQWLKRVTQMVNPTTTSLQVRYDDAQSFSERGRKKCCSFKSVGIRSQGSTIIFKINDRHTRQILQTSNAIADDLLTAQDTGDDGIPLVKPIRCGRDGQAPLVIRLPNLHAEATNIAERLSAAHQEDHAWDDMAVICRRYDEIDECGQALNRTRLPHQMRKGAGSFHPNEDTIKVLTMHASKRQEFPEVAPMGVRRMPAADEADREDVWLFHVGQDAGDRKSDRYRQRIQQVLQSN